MAVVNDDLDRLYKHANSIIREVGDLYLEIATVIIDPDITAAQKRALDICSDKLMGSAQMAMDSVGVKLRQLGARTKEERHGSN